MSKGRLSGVVRYVSCGVAAVVATIGPAISLAQYQAASSIEEIVITGTRLSVDKNLASSSPVTTVDRQELQFGGVTRVEDLVNDLPQIVPELTSNDSNGSTGTATLDLRGLGSERTLVLINGRRIGSGDPFALAPDINQVPGNLIERVELLTGGASSTYGSDAVAGVVNFIMKDDLDGFQLDYQVSGYNHVNNNAAARQAVSSAGYEAAPGSVSDGEATNISFVAGLDLPKNRGNVTAYLGYREIEEILQASRDYSACALSGEDGVVGSCVGSPTTAQGTFRNFANPETDLILDLDTGDLVPRTASYNFAPLNYFQRPDTRYTAGLFGRYEFQEGLETYVEFQFMDDRNLAQIAPSGTFFNNSELNCDNPLLSTQQFNAIGCMNPTDRVPFFVGKRNVEGDPRISDLQHISSRSLVGLRADIGDYWEFDGFVNVTRLDYTEIYHNDLSIQNIVKALDIVDDGSGNAVCRSSLPGGSDPACVPYNIFQPDGVTEEAVSYLTLPLFSSGDLDMRQGVAYLSGSLTDYGIKSPTAREGVDVVVGIEYRDEELNLDLDQNYNNGNAAGRFGATPDVSGAILVKEFFAEARVPVVQDRPAFLDLSLDVRFRTSDYDSGVNTSTWNVGGAWQPVEPVKLRASLSRAVRAPNINELFAPQFVEFWQGDDPCAGSSPELTEAQCALTGVPAGAYGAVPASPSGRYNGLFGGNPNLGAETSDSVTAGLLLTSDTILPGFTLSADYWQIEVDDAIGTLNPEDAIRECGLTGVTSLCSLIARNPSNGNVWVGSGPDAPRIIATNINIGKFDVAGVDLNGTYGTVFGRHSLDFALRGTLVTRWDRQGRPGGEIDDCKGKWGGRCGRPRPKWKHTFSTTWGTPVEALDLVGNWRYIGDIQQFGGGLHTAAQSYIDLSGRYSFDWYGGLTQLTVGIQNIADEDPPVHGLFNSAPFSNGNTIPGTWDALGRYWFIGLTYSR